jgi:hypothetical protein
MSYHYAISELCAAKACQTKNTINIQYHQNTVGSDTSPHVLRFTGFDHTGASAAAWNMPRGEEITIRSAARVGDPRRVDETHPGGVEGAACAL